jgi:hypothetical protein
MDRREPGYDPKGCAAVRGHMAEARNYLFGYGERLKEPLEPLRRPIKKFHPYTISEARERLTPRIQRLPSLPSARSRR